MQMLSVWPKLASAFPLLPCATMVSVEGGALASEGTGQIKAATRERGMPFQGPCLSQPASIVTLTNIPS